MTDYSIPHIAGQAEGDIYDASDIEKINEALLKTNGVLKGTVSIALNQNSSIGFTCNIEPGRSVSDIASKGLREMGYSTKVFQIDPTRLALDATNNQFTPTT